MAAKNGVIEGCGCFKVSVELVSAVIAFENVPENLPLLLPTLYGTPRGLPPAYFVR